jgi:chemosensory pili system protein ChpB (putative protein-glutamate methylesterase)
MNKAARRVALLARPGAARDRMREALDLAGANIVLEADPATTDQEAVLAAEPEAALIVLDAATDEALDRFDGVVCNPRIEVFFEEAEVAVGRVGWDAARWVRHLRAKLLHSDDVLPPGQQEPGAPAPVEPRPATPEIVAARPVPEPETEPAPATVARLELSLADLDDGAARETGSGLELVAIEFGDEVAGHARDHGAGTVPSLPAGFALEGIEGMADLPAEDKPFEISFEGLELESEHPADASRFQDDMADLHSRIAAMELVEDRAPAPLHGAVLVLAGIGGPDAVRQLLGALPEAFPRAVLVLQRLDGGHYDKLVAQMQRATTMPVKLALAGDALQAGTVYIVPPTLGVQENARRLVFNDAPAELLASLPANDSAVLMLSGSDPAQVDVVMKLAGAGALVAAQALDGCYDVAAPAALASRGGLAAKPQDLARRLAERWH